MSQRYSSNDEILRNIALLVPMSSWPRRDSVLARLAEAVHPSGFTTWAALWADGTCCTLVVGVDQKRPPSEKIVRAYRQYHDRRQDDINRPLEGPVRALYSEGGA
jgi:hypothetical protein